MRRLRESPPEIDYLAKDYASFRQLMLDHLALSVPEWKEPSEADLGNVLVEILAYAADYLSYYQDAVATEAYLGTARLRSSIKRHVRLLDYVLHEGCNTRVWVQVQVSASFVLPKATQLLTHVGGLGNTPIIAPNSSAYDEVLQQQPKVFETLHVVRLFPEHNEIALYAEEGEEAILPVGCTSALLCQPGHEHEHRLRLRSGDVLIFEEVKNAETSEAIGVDLTRRHAVRLTEVKAGERRSQPIVHVAWADEDAFPFPLRIAVSQQGDMISGISVARGNIVLADHGLTIRHEVLPSVISNARYRPYLRHTDLTYAVPYDHEQALARPAGEATLQDVQMALPVIALFQQSSTEPMKLDPGLEPELHSLNVSSKLHQQLSAQGVVLSSNVTIRAVHGVGWELHDTIKNRYWLTVPKDKQLQTSTFTKWTLRRDLLSSGPLASDYTVDMEEDRRARLRFGFGKQGRQPMPGDRFQVTYRIGGGELGNVRADTINHIVTTDVRIMQVRNPLAAQGGTEPESIEEARLNAPYAFRTQERCVTQEDYAEIATRHPQVANAVARLRWTGNWSSAYIYVQRYKGQAVDAAFAADLVRFLEDFRLTGHEIEIRGPYYVALHIALKVYLQRQASRSIVSNALARAFSNDRGSFFYPDNFTFGQTVYQSQVIARAMDVPGVMQVEVEQFCRLDTSTPDHLEQILVQPLEIARLDNDETAPYNGIILFHLEGGL